MHKLLCFAGLLLSANVCNAVELDSRVGIQFWQATSKGALGEADDSLLNWDQKEDAYYRFYWQFEHNLRLFPHFKLGYTEQSFSDQALLTQTYRLNNELYPVGSNLTYSGESAVVDATAFYSLINRDILQLDAGVNVRYQSSEYLIRSDVSEGTDRTEISSIIPFGYVKLASSLPLIGIDTYMQYQVSESKSELEMAFGYRFVNTSSVDLHIYIGYIDQEVTHDYVDGVYANAEWESVFVALESRF